MNEYVFLKKDIPEIELKVDLSMSFSMEDKPIKKTKSTAIRTKKEKKPINVVAVVTPDGIEGTFAPEPRKPLIIHLPFQSGEIEFNTPSEICYDPNPPKQPEPYDFEHNLYFRVNSENCTDATEIGVEQEGWKMDTEKKAVKTSSSTEPQAEISKVVLVEEKKSPVTHATLLISYETKPNETLKVPEKTEVACFHCTECFETSPFFAPVKEENEVYHVRGNFCCLECTLSYILNDKKINSHVRWEMISLLYRMYKVNGRIYPAPPKESNVKYGGPYTSQQIRDIINQKKVRIDIQTPPMVSILSKMDTKPIDFYDSSIQNTFTGGFSLDRFRNWSEQGGALRLKRSKPLKDRESTLDSLITIRNR
jgi:hypothetical protein